MLPSSEILCQEALPALIGNSLFWSSSRDMREGNAGRCPAPLAVSLHQSTSFLASRLLNVNQYPCLCMIVHHGSQQTVQLKLDRYSGTQRGFSRLRSINTTYCLDPDEYLAEIINGIQHADQTLEHNR